MSDQTNKGFDSSHEGARLRETRGQTCQKPSKPVAPVANWANPAAFAEVQIGVGLGNSHKMFLFLVLLLNIGGWGWTRKGLFRSASMPQKRAQDGGKTGLTQRGDHCPTTQKKKILNSLFEMLIPLSSLQESSIISH